MNIQAMMKQAQKLQKEMMEEKNKIDKMEFVGKSSFVTVKVNGEKKIISVTIEQEELGKEDLELVEDMIVVATNDAMKQVDDVTEQKMGKYTKGMPGLF